MKFKIKPVLAICLIVTFPELNTIALGGVATGSINANDADKVAGIINSNGLMFIATAIAASIGSKVCVVAVFDVNSVKNVRQARGTIREAVTEYRVLRHNISIEGKKFTLVEVLPKTGRLHQIRAHFSAIGHPVAGDLKYGPKNRVLLETLNRHFLHAESLEIDIPQGAGNSKKMIFLAPLPKELKNLISI
ncbi:MAG: Pseudouridine synthase [Candidatus Moranbacteria bacterium GW2011_GWF2_37_7]|nr:MAG: Pseudouridine synthase [Candidatus Moranbacteria bacterium GW2011_GWF2_37_7]